MQSSLRKKICQAIIDRKGHYFLSIKKNNPAKMKEMALQFKIKKSKAVHQVNLDHGRLEERTLWAMPVPEHLRAWSDVKQIIKIRRRRLIKGKQSEEIVYGITSLSPKQAKPAGLLKLSRDHWSIENSLHWVRDESLGEDRSRIRKGSSPQVMAALRNGIIHLIHEMGLVVAQAIEQSMRFFKRPITWITEN
jgi:predicted transposase YbfD/YdcC